MNGAKRTPSLSSMSQGNATFPAVLFIASTHQSIFFFFFFFFAIIPTTTTTDNHKQYKQRNGTPDTRGTLQPHWARSR